MFPIIYPSLPSSGGGAWLHLKKPVKEMNKTNWHQNTSINGETVWPAKYLKKRGADVDSCDENEASIFYNFTAENILPLVIMMNQNQAIGSLENEMMI